MGNHFLPQKYLRRFGSEGVVWVHDRASLRSFQSGVRAVAHEVGLYSDEVETDLNINVEAPTHAIFDKIEARKAVTEVERRALAKYIVVFWKRVPKGRDRALGRIPKVADEVHDELMVELDELVEQDASFTKRAGEIRLQVKEVIASQKRSPSPRLWYEGFGGVEGSLVEETLLSMNWVFLCSETPQFLTSDNPVFFFDHEGIGSPLSELTFPISSSVALWATRHHIGSGYMSALASGVKQINRRTARNSQRFVFSATNEPWINPFVMKGGWELKRLKP